MLTIPAITTELENRFRGYIRVEEHGCWEWLGNKDRHEYGRYYMLRRIYGAHRVAYTWWAGIIPDGLQIDHLCRNRGCVNPAHLEPVTGAENTRRSPLVGRNHPGRAMGSHCKQGHEFTEENTRITRQGYRICRTCHKRDTAEWKRRTNYRHAA